MLSEAALADLYREAGPYALSKTSYLVGCRNVAEEIVQDVFLKLWQKQPVFPSAQHAYAWVYKACHNAGVDYLRSRRRLAAAARFDIVEQLKEPDCPADRLANQEILARILSQMSEREARIVTYRFIDGIGLDAIAAMMELSEKTVRRTLQSLIERHAAWRSLRHVNAQ